MNKNDEENLGVQSMPDGSYNTSYKVGQDNVLLFGLDVHNPVFGTSAGLIVLFVLGTLIFPADANALLTGVRGWSIEHFDWLFMIATNIFVLFSLALIVLPVGKIRIGGEDAKPEFSRISWFCMLFSAGTGIGLMFWGVAEPIAYYTDWNGTPLNVVPRTIEAQSTAMATTAFHWGLHGWAIYGVVALALAFFSFNKRLPFTIRSTFYPILGEKCWGTAGHVIDILATLATIFGLATSLGLGAQQATSGLHFLFGASNSIDTQLVVITVITLLAMISVYRGMDGGVKLLSNINMLIAGFMLAFVFIISQTGTILESIWHLFGSYAENILPLSNWIGRDDSDWMHNWTIFYWAWWISWSPFVGMFIARVSKGRTVREFMISVLVVPTLVTLIWIGVMGGNAIEQATHGVGQLANGVTDASLVMFQMLDNLPMTSLTSFVAIALVMVFFITSADSGAIVLDSITSGGKTDAPTKQRLFWAFMVGLIAAALLIGGGAQALKTLQSGAIATGLPFTFVLLAMCYSLYLGLNEELKRINRNNPVKG